MRKHSLAAIIAGAFCVSAFAANGPVASRATKMGKAELANSGPAVQPQSVGPCGGQPCSYFTDFDDTADFTAGTWIGNGLNGATAGGVLGGWSATCTSNPANWPGAVTPAEGHVETANPFSGTQHVRISYDPNMITNPFGCVADARNESNAAATANPGTVTPNTLTMELAQPAGPFGPDFTLQPQQPSAGFLTTRWALAYFGTRYLLDDVNGLGITYVVAGSWDTSGTYGQYTIHTDPCAHFSCNGGANDGLACAGIQDCPGGACYGSITYSDSNGFTYTGQLWAGTAIEQILVYSDNTGGGNPTGLDIDDVGIERDPNPCPQVCGDGSVDGTEECETGVGLDGACPGHCVAPGNTGPEGEAECTCATGPCSVSQDLPNGGPQDFTGGAYFGWFTFTADAPAYAVDTCGVTEYDSELSVWTGTCDSLSLLNVNDDCSNYPGFGDNSDPLASCYDAVNYAGPYYNACLCVSTTEGQQYWVWDDRVAYGQTTTITLTKRLSCDNGDQTYGACCGGPFVGGCTDVASAAACQGGTFSATKTCAGVGDQCPAQTQGACCDEIAGSCTETDAAGCQGTFSLGSHCADVSCVAATGACCDSATGDCSEVTSAECQGASQTWSNGVACADLDPPCQPPYIPTVSEWGLVIMALLLLVGAKVYFGRREAMA